MRFLIGAVVILVGVLFSSAAWQGRLTALKDALVA